MNIKFTILAIFLVAVLGASVIHHEFQLNDIKKSVSGISGQINMAGWTENEKMNYEMHGTIPARVSGSSGSSSGMVGGC